jgi:hypothetical protein
VSHVTTGNKNYVKNVRLHNRQLDKQLMLSSKIFVIQIQILAIKVPLLSEEIHCTTTPQDHT